MADIINLVKSRPPEVLLEEVIAEAQKNPLKAVVIITKDSSDTYQVSASAGSGVLERVGMCQYGASVLLAMMRSVP